MNFNYDDIHITCIVKVYTYPCGVCYKLRSYKLQAILAAMATLEIERLRRKGGYLYNYIKHTIKRNTNGE